MECVQTLLHEHDIILRVLDIVHRASLIAISSDAVDVHGFREMIGFIRNFIDKIHHEKEEAFLFKAIMDELGDVGENLIRHGMLVEHDIGWLYISDLETALDAYLAQPTIDAKLSILVAAGSYVQMLRRHMLKENDVVFPFGMKNLSRKSINWIESQTEKFEADKANAHERARQLAILAELERKYG